MPLRPGPGLHRGGLLLSVSEGRGACLCSAQRRPVPRGQSRTLLGACRITTPPGAVSRQHRPLELRSAECCRRGCAGYSRRFVESIWRRLAQFHTRPSRRKGVPTWKPGRRVQLRAAREHCKNGSGDDCKSAHGDILPRGTGLSSASQGFRKSLGLTGRTAGRRQPSMPRRYCSCSNCWMNSSLLECTCSASVINLMSSLQERS